MSSLKIVHLLLLCGLPLLAWGQRCGFTDTRPIGDQGMTNIMVNIEDYLNNDLANAGQGLCGVSVYFQHSYVYDFTLTVTSPAGQSVELIGPINNQTRPPTNLTRWFIDFDRCAEPFQPDPGASGVWNNNFPFNWSAFGTFRGDYHPANGCLEDFNTGPVNGDWTFSFNTERFGQSGRATYLLLEFCDDANAQGPCCFANAGELQPIPNLEFCEQTPNLPLGLPPRYRQPRPDAAQYDYTYVIARNDSILFTQDDPNLGMLQAGSYEICGLSYRTGELDQLNLDGSLDFDELRADFDAVTPAFCGDLTSVCQTVNLYPIPEPRDLNVTICEGSAYLIGGTNYFTSGTRQITLVGRAGCDSIVNLTLDVVTEIFADVDTTICAESVYVQGGNVYDMPGIFVDTVASFQGCDSIVTLNLSFAAPIIADTTVFICAGDTFRIGSEQFTTGQMVTRTILALNGCDSTVNLNLNVIDPMIVFAPHADGLSCDEPTIELNAAGSTFGFTNRGVWTDQDGTDLSFFRRYTVDSAGLYIYELTNAVENPNVGCTVKDSILIEDYRIDVTPDLALTRVQCNGAEDVDCAFISCRNPTLGIQATTLPNGPAYDYRWTAPAGGNIVGPATGREIVVDAPGTYTLTIEDPATGCDIDTFYTIGIDTLTPITRISGNQLLNCDTTSLLLSADTLQPFRERLSFVWTGDCLPQPVNGPTIALDCGGSVTLTVTNRRSGCFRDTTFLVRQDISPSTLSLAPATPPLSCYFPVRELDASGSFSANGQEFSWTYEGGTDTISTAAIYDATRAGTYRLTAFDSISRCADVRTIVVPADTLKPVAFSGADTVSLNCYAPTATLGGDPSSQGPEFRYAWVRAADLQDTFARTRTLFVEGEGALLNFSVFNIDNGCLTESSTRVLNRLDTPRIRIAEPLDFECFIDSVALDARLTNLDFDNVRQWSGPCLAPGVDTNLTYAYCPGLYQYSVINQETGCAATDSVELFLGPNSVVAVLPDSAFLDCNTGETRLDRSFGTQAPVVRWFRGDIPVVLPGLRPRVTVPGVYTLVLGNFNESCLDTARITVVADCPALAIIVPPDSITCDRPLVILDATTSVPSVGPNVTTEWLIPGGAITLPGENDRLLQVFSPGTFGFVVNNLISGDVDTSYAIVRENTIPPVAIAGELDTVNCYNRTITVNGAGSSVGPLFDYRWSNSADVEISDSLTARVSAGGIYLLEVTQRETGCSTIDNVRIVGDLDAPEVSFTSAVIPCDTVDFALTAIPDGPASDYLFDWTGPDIIAGEDNDTVRIRDVGLYGAKVTRVSNGCAVDETTLATRLPCPPFPRLQDTSLSCGSGEIMLVTTFRDPCEGCTYTWRRNGDIIPDENDTTLPVNETGTYQIVAINRFGLVGGAEATVTDSRFVPAENAGEDRILTCVDNDALLWNPEPEPDFPLVYRWFGPDGNVVPGADLDSLRATTGGLYQLETTNTFSNCTVVDTVMVRYDTIAPIADAGPGRLLDCDNKRRVLDGINSSLGREFVYRWSGGPSVACMEGGTTLNPLVRCGGDYQLRVLDTMNGCFSTAVVTVDVDEELPIVLPLPDTTLNCAAGVINLIGEDISRPNIRYGWESVQPGHNLPLAETGPGVLEVAEEGEFRFFILDTLNGCFNDFSLTVAADLEVPTVQTSESDTFFCALDSLFITGIGQASLDVRPELLWESRTGFFVGGATTTRATIFQPDTYYFTVTNPRNFCAMTDSVVIFRDVNAPVAFAGADTTLTCNRRSVQVSGRGTTVSGEATFEWTTRDGAVLSGDQTATPFLNATGNYLFTITDPVNQCSGADILRVTEDTLRPFAQIETPQGLRIDCNRPEIDLRGRVFRTDGGGATVRWVGPPDSDLTNPEVRQVTVASSGRFRFIATNPGNGCRDTASLIISEDFTKPIVNIPPPATLSCNRDSITLDIAAVSPLVSYRYVWRNAADSLLGLTSDQVVREQGVYSLITRDLANGCLDTSRVAVSGDFIAPEVIIADPPLLNCARALTTIDGTQSTRGPDFDLRWRSPRSSAVTDDEDPYLLRGREPGFYYLTVSNRSNGCITTDSVEVIREAISIENLELEVDQPACSSDRDGSVMVVGVSGGSGPFRYRLDGGLITERMVYEGLPLGTYNLQVIGTDGCSTDRDFTIVEGFTPLVELREDTTVNLGDSVYLDFVTTFDNYDTLLWTSSGPLPDVSSNEPIWVQPLESQTYRLVVRDEEGCLATSSVVVTVNGRIDVYVPSAFSPNGDNTNDLFRPYPGSQIEEITVFKIYDRWGELLYDIQSDPARDTDIYGWDGRLKGKPMDPQVYVWELEVKLVDGEIERVLGDFILMK